MLTKAKISKLYGAQFFNNKKKKDLSYTTIILRNSAGKRQGNPLTR